MTNTNVTNNMNNFGGQQMPQGQPMNQAMYQPQATPQTQQPARIKITDSQTQAALANEVGHVVEIVGELGPFSDIINKKEGAALAEYNIQLKNHNRKPRNSACYTLRVVNPEFRTPFDANSIVDRIVQGYIYNATNKSTNTVIPTINADIPNDFNIGFLDAKTNTVYQIDRSTIQGQHFANNQKIMVTYSCYYHKGQGSYFIGVDNVIFLEGKPKFYSPQNRISGSMSWSNETVDLSGSAPQIAAQDTMTPVQQAYGQPQAQQMPMGQPQGMPMNQTMYQPQPQPMYQPQPTPQAQPMGQMPMGQPMAQPQGGMPMGQEQPVSEDILSLFGN